MARSFVLALFALALVSGCAEVKARRMIQKGNQSYADGNYDQAVKDFEAGLAVFPTLSTGWYNLGLAHLASFSAGSQDPVNEAHAQGAIRALAKYLEAHPADEQARDMLLSTYIDSGHYEGALAYFEDRLQKNPADVQAVAQLAEINKQAMNFDEANRWYRKRVEIDPSTDGKADAYYLVGALNWRRLHWGAEIKGEDRIRLADEGLAALAEADRLRPNHKNTIVHVNLLYRERAHGHDAFAAKVIDLATAQVYYKRGVALAQEEKKRTAEAAAAAAANPQAPEEPKK